MRVTVEVLLHTRPEFRGDDDGYAGESRIRQSFDSRLIFAAPRYTRRR
jgi:hypothetical protein